MISTGKLMKVQDDLREALIDINKPIPTQSWMRADDDPLHDFRIVTEENRLTIIADSREARMWLKDLKDDILPSLAWKLKLMTPEDIQEAEEELCRAAQY